MSEYIRGVNLGNWLVLERWMQPELFEGSGAEDEIWLYRKKSREELEPVIKKHRDTYVTEQDFCYLAERGANAVRIPVPFFVFGDRKPYIGCIEYLDQAFLWAQKYGLKVLIDLHTCPGSQNGYDNGGLTGVCKWCKNPQEVEYVLTVLERLSERYGHEKNLYGIEVLNEPISFVVWITAPSTGKAVDKKEAKGSGHVPMKFLKSFYQDAYWRMRKFLPEEKVIVFHDGFRLSSWKDFFVKCGMKNVVLDTHIYVQAMETFIPLRNHVISKLYLGWQETVIQRASRYTPVMVGEWCLTHKAGSNPSGSYASEKERQEARKKAYNRMADMQFDIWKRNCIGYFYWNYQLCRKLTKRAENNWLEAWDVRRCLENGWIQDGLK